MFSQEDSHASRSVLPGTEQANQMTVTSGLRCSEQLKNQGPASLWLKMLLVSSAFSSPRVLLKWSMKRLGYFVKTKTSREQVPLNESSEELSPQSLKTLGKQDMYYPNLPTAHQSFVVCQLQVLVPRTKGIGSGLLLLSTPNAQPMADITPERAIKLGWIWRNGSYYRPDGSKEQTTLSHQIHLLPTPKAAMATICLLPTPQARDIKNGSSMKDGRTQRKILQGWSFGINDLAKMNLLPTPQAIDGEGNGRPLRKKTGNRNPDTPGTWRGDLKDYAAQNLLPTPTSTSDVKGGCTRKDASRQNDTLAHAPHAQVGIPGKTSQLNHRFVAEMMGFPPGWTVLPFQNGEKKA